MSLVILKGWVIVSESNGTEDVEVYDGEEKALEEPEEWEIGLEVGEIISIREFALVQAFVYWDSRLHLQEPDSNLEYPSHISLILDTAGEIEKYLRQGYDD